MQTAAQPIVPRNPKLAFDEKLPRYWFGGSIAATLIANGVNLLFPAGERFFIRSVRHYMDRIDDPALLEQVKGFFGQEGRHAQAHERFFQVMRNEGYDIDTFLRRYEKIAFEMLEPRAPKQLSLAVTAALEHFTAIMAENALSRNVLEKAHPEMQRLLLWHAAEEIEHKALAFDVLKKVNPSYALRMSGLAVGGFGLALAWLLATITLAKMDGSWGRGDFSKSYKKMKETRPEPDVFVRGIREYVRRDFHPSDNDNYHLASDYLASAGIALVAFGSLFRRQFAIGRDVELLPIGGQRVLRKELASAITIGAVFAGEGRELGEGSIATSLENLGEEEHQGVLAFFGAVQDREPEETCGRRQSKREKERILWLRAIFVVLRDRPHHVLDVADRKRCVTRAHERSRRLRFFGSAMERAATIDVAKAGKTRAIARWFAHVVARLEGVRRGAIDSRA